ncbi:MAG: hypothetical protein A2X61_16895 [Ignavibacteria bacterium GWB2_35_12]|nr:MAG: hypothetical protein A2X63_02005 [Ignavibacteria bacterium GWA2_35_8]OGU38028.1 MAG: hypothetical protein A2X61_16895 [Ignavibacteria bacterium GWB2_35_12]OGU89110.1 MAG: hypothetical protein A2220_15410 [Ignavibacteria bacterium RIFOXYA2_FULL_35_10]OGV25050.1 MAG: hypothetical protein A2475_16730 [Ignavibacteria bacterium RIFOXYC2_FULL_35_21]
MDTDSYKIAVVSNNGTSVSQHYGSARFYEVFTIENNAVIKHERREKVNFHAAGHPYNQHLHQHQHGGIKSIPLESDTDMIMQKGQSFGMGQGAGIGFGSGMGHGWDHHSEDKHNTMIGNILDCKYLLARGMGYGIYDHLHNAGIEPIVTYIQLIEKAVKAVIEQNIVNHTEKLH